MSFGENLRTVRKERNISQEELAEQLHVSRQVLLPRARHRPLPLPPPRQCPQARS